MTFTGPWLQGPDLWVEQPVDNNTASPLGESLSINRPEADAGRATSSSFLNASDLNGGLVNTDAVYPPLHAGWECDPATGTFGQWRFTVGFGFLGFLAPGPFVPPPPLPPRAIDLEWEGGSSHGTWLGGYEVWIDVLALTGSDTWDFFDVTPRRSLASFLVPLFSLAAPGVGDHVKIVPDGSGLLLTSGEWRGQAHCATDTQMYGSSPVADAAIDNPAGGASMTYSLTQRTFVHPPRHRFIYDTLPPLRQFPRDDFLGGTPRQGHQSTSTQASPRQGYSNTYR